MTVGILLVGGRGTRLAPITSEIPKPMLPVAGKPVTEHQILAAQRAGITTLVLATSYLSEVFIPYFGDGSKWGIDLRYAVEKEPLGTGGAIANAAAHLDKSASDEAVVIFNGDVLSQHDLAAQIDFHKRCQADVTLHLIQVEDARAFGCVPTAADGRVEAFLEKMENPVTNWINAGCYVFSREVIDSIPRETVISVERETFPGLITDNRRVFGYKEDAYWLDIGNPGALFKGSQDLVAADSLISPSAAVDSTAVLTGGTSIGAGAEIGAGAVLDNCIVSAGAIVKARAHLSRSFLAPAAIVEEDARYEDRYISAQENLPIIF
ncbi:MAG: nucleotidyltransferase family protein [Candidatus Planktophila sp.]|nr:nucleotidyltransferase family protein [Candidatus Planktophila sp.]